MFLLKNKLHGNYYFFFFNDTATTEIYTLSLHDALPIYGVKRSTKIGEQHDYGQHGDGMRGRFQKLGRSEEHTSELQSQSNLVCRLLLEKKKIRSHKLYINT